MNSITIYSTPNCFYCKKAKEYFQSKGIEYTEFDVSRDIEKQKEMVQKTAQFGVPVLEVNGKVIVGFDRAKIDASLN